jgi:anti-sigma B factor antagonist
MPPSVDQIGNVAVVTPNTPQLDISNSEDFLQAVQPLLDEQHRVVFDLRRVTFVDSSGCGAILSCLKRVRDAGGDLKLCEATEPVGMVFELIRLHRICDIFKTQTEAVAAFHSK